MKVGDTVRSPKSLWAGDIGTISGIIEREKDPYGDLVHVIFPENDKHHAYQQSIDSKDLTVLKPKEEK